MHRLILAAGACFGASSIALGAFGAHALRARLDPRATALWQLASQYLSLHAVLLVAVAALAAHDALRPTILAWVAWGISAGVLLFCGSLYALALGAPSVTGVLTPIGGMTLLAGWLGLAWYAWRLAA